MDADLVHWYTCNTLLFLAPIVFCILHFGRQKAEYGRYSPANGGKDNCCQNIIRTWRSWMRWCFKFVCFLFVCFVRFVSPVFLLFWPRSLLKPYSWKTRLVLSCNFSPLCGSSVSTRWKQYQCYDDEIQQQRSSRCSWTFRPPLFMEIHWFCNHGKFQILVFSCW